jgi:hypothetical protein
MSSTPSRYLHDRTTMSYTCQVSQALILSPPNTMRATRKKCRAFIPQLEHRQLRLAEYLNPEVAALVRGRTSQPREKRRERGILQRPAWICGDCRARLPGSRMAASRRRIRSLPTQYPSRKKNMSKKQSANPDLQSPRNRAKLSPVTAESGTRSAATAIRL